MAVLVVRSTTGITKYYPVVRGIDVSMTGLALGCEQRLGRLPPLDALRWFWYYRDECDGLVDTSAGLSSRGQWGVGI
jgi:hypothetical protein